MSVRTSDRNGPLGATNTLGLLRCPQCTGPLDAHLERLWCVQCRRRWLMEDGVPCLGGKDFRRHGLSPTDRQSVVEDAVKNGWATALHDRMRSLDPAIYRQAVDEYRAQWHFV